MKVYLHICKELKFELSSFPVFALHHNGNWLLMFLSKICLDMSFKNVYVENNFGIQCMHSACSTFNICICFKNLI